MPRLLIPSKLKEAVNNFRWISIHSVNCGDPKSPEHLSQFSAATVNLLITDLSVCHNVHGNRLKYQLVCLIHKTRVCVEDKLKRPARKICHNLLPENMGMLKVAEYI